MENNNGQKFRRPASQIADRLVRTGLGVVFIWASWDKIWHPAEFAVIVSNYSLLPDAAINPTALLLPWFELLCGLLLLGGRLVPGAALSVDALLVIFILATGFNLYRGLDINCGCFSVSPDAGGQARLHLVRNGLLLAAGLWLFFHNLGQAGAANRQPAGGAVNHAG